MLRRPPASNIQKKHRINEEITAPEVRLIDEEGNQAGVISIKEALLQADKVGVDLVEIAPNANPPVVKIIDYGKLRYQEAKKAHEAKAKQKVVTIKEIKFRPSTDEGDYKIKMRNLLRFLEDGDKVKVTLRFRGREIAHQEFGAKLLERIRDELTDHGQVEQMPKMEGRQMVMMVSPLRKK